MLQFLNLEHAASDHNARTSRRLSLDTSRERFSYLESLSVALEVLNLSFVLLRRLAGVEGAEVASFAGLFVYFAGVDAVLAVLEFSDHGSLMAGLRREIPRTRA